MPQMAPMSWLILFFIFSVTFIFFIVLNYFLMIYHPKLEKSKKIKQQLINWKW
uniref:ATP synthase complex subunit 8 n=1 Tax=Agrilus sp. AGR01 TaxID=1205534 RepID=A0A0S2MRM9_9COLE|nr:ATP synthase F0 subunit 8 [Agrilus sp. AGR01]